MLFISASAMAMAAATSALPEAAPAAPSAPLLAEGAAATEGGDDQPGTIVVTGTRDAYGADRTSSATRTDTPLQDVPQSVSVVTEAQIDDQAMRSLADVVRYVPGATIGQGEGHRDQITLRGNNSTSDFFIDGLRDDVQYYRPLYNLQRIEVLRGPNAMIFGRGGGGGVINRVTKQPFGELVVGGSASVNTFGAWHADADVNVPVGEALAVRVNGVHEQFANHRDVYEGELSAINPAARLIAGPHTSFSLSYEYLEDARIVDRGIPAEAGRPLQGFRDTFFGDPEVNRSGFEAHILRGTAEHEFSDALSLVSRLQYADYDKFYRNIFAAGPVTGTGANRRVDVSGYFSATQRENLFSQTDLLWKVSTGPVSHTLLAGVELGRQDSGVQRLEGYFDSGVPTGDSGRRTSVPLGETIAVPPITFRPPANRDVVSEADIFALYVQNQAEFGPVELIAGLRYDRFKLAVDNLVNGQSFSRTDELWSPRVGLIFHPVEPVSLYASFSRSYLPQSGDQFDSLDLTAAALEPERFDNVEAGVKWQVRPGFLLSAAVYQLDRTNTRAPGPNPGEVVLTGSQRSRGIELEAAGEIARGWQLSLAYTLQEAEITERTSAAPTGREVPLVPTHLFSAWSRYDVSDRFGVGLGVTHQSESFTSISNAVELPSFTRVDLGLFLKLTDQIRAQVNVENLLDEDYFPTAHSDSNITPGAPLNARFTLRFGF